MMNTMSYLKSLIVITFSIILVFLFISFRSVMIPLRMVLTALYTFTTSIGFMVLLFQTGFLKNIWTVMENTDRIHWAIVIMSCPIISALALDYDVFLLVTIVNYKKLKYNDEAAIIKGVWHTSRIITFAGLIMGLSIGSIIFSDIVLLIQIGILLSMAVLLDTFIVRSFLVPALLAIYPTINWWPQVFENLYGLEDFVGEVGYDENQDELPPKNLNPMNNECDAKLFEDYKISKINIDSNYFKIKSFNRIYIILN